MTHPHPHRPDVEDAARWYDDAVEMVGLDRDRAARDERLDPGRVRTALDDVWEALAWGWVTQRPPAELEALVVHAVEVLRAGLDTSTGRPLGPLDVERLVTAALLAGDVEAAGRAAARDVPPPVEPVEWRAAALTALVRRDDAAAGAAVERLRAVVADPTTAPFVADWLAHLDEVADAVLRRDQAAFDDALAARARVVARVHRTARMRRRWTGLLDRYAIALARVAEQRGLVVPPDVPVVPAELLAVVGAAAARVAAPPSRARDRRWPWWGRRTRAGGGRAV